MEPEEEKARLTRQWLRKAQRDLLAAERAAAGSPPLLDVAVYHHQQAVEKALKGFLTWHDQPFRRTHDLLQLVQQCEQIDPNFIRLRNAATLLTPYVAEFRYPGAVEEPTAEEAEVSQLQARDAVLFVIAELPEGHG